MALRSVAFDQAASPGPSWKVPAMRARRMTSSWRRVMAAAAAATIPFVLVAAATATAHAESGSASVASPAVSGPVGGGTPAEFMFSTNFNLAQVGYQEQEFFVSG